MLNIKQIQYFAACAKTGSFSQAAELLFTTQSNVSKVIRSMEDDMRTQLFVRHAKESVHISMCRGSWKI